MQMGTRQIGVTCWMLIFLVSVSALGRHYIAWRSVESHTDTLCTSTGY